MSREEKKVGMEGGALLMTGATGFVGSHFVHRFLSRGQGRLVALVRGESAAAARLRLREQLGETAASYCEPAEASALETRLEVLAGDIREEHGGLSPEQIARLRGQVDEMWHFAASLAFEERFAEEIRALNLHATQKMLALAARLGVRRFVYVSTAYTCGARAGRVEEELHDPAGPFNNVYEETKCAAEHAVSTWGRMRAIDVRILRPSVVVGPSTTLMTGGSDTGLYGFYRELYRVRRLLREARGPIAISGDATASLNLVAVDHVVEDMLELRARDFPAGPIYHLTSAHNPKLGELLPLTCAVADVEPMVFADRPVEERTPLEQLLERRTVFYRGYLQGDKEFARALKPRRGPSLDEIRGYLVEYERELKKENRDALFRRHTVIGVDSTRLCAYAAGEAERPAILLVNALGMPATFFIPLAKRLAEQFFVLTWESRGVPNLDMEFDVSRCAPEQHVADALAVLAHFNVRSAAVVAWCTGAQIGLQLATQAPERVDKLVLLNGSISAAWAPASAFQRKLEAILPSSTRSVRNAQLYCDLLHGQAAGALSDSDHTSSQKFVSSVLSDLDPSVIHLTSAPFRNGTALYRYANLLLRYKQAAERDWSGAARPTLVVAAEGDQITLPESAVELARRLPNARLQMRQGDHYLLYFDPTLGDEISSFVAEEEPKRVPASGGRA